jgi:hypothetical protein
MTVSTSPWSSHKQAQRKWTKSSQRLQIHPKIPDKCKTQNSSSQPHTSNQQTPARTPTAPNPTCPRGVPHLNTPKPKPLPNCPCACRPSCLCPRDHPSPSSDRGSHHASLSPSPSTCPRRSYNRPRPPLAENVFSVWRFGGIETLRFRGLADIDAVSAFMVAGLPVGDAVDTHFVWTWGR